MNPFRRYRQWAKDEFILCYADTSWGGADYCAAQFMSKDTVDVPLVYHQQGLASDMTPRLHQELERIYDVTRIKPVVSYERNNGGIAELERLAALNRDGKYRIYTQYTGIGTTDMVEPDTKMGHDTTRFNREGMLALLKDAIDNRIITIYDKLTVEEMFSFVVKKTASGQWKAQAENNAHDDLIMSLAGVWQMFQTERKPVPVNRSRGSSRPTRSNPGRSKLHV